MRKASSFHGSFFNLRFPPVKRAHRSLTRRRLFPHREGVRPPPPPTATGKWGATASDIEFRGLSDGEKVTSGVSVGIAGMELLLKHSLRFSAVCNERLTSTYRSAKNQDG